MKSLNLKYIFILAALAILTPLIVFSCQATRLTLPQTATAPQQSRSAFTYSELRPHPQGRMLLVTADTGVRDGDNQPHADALLVRDIAAQVCAGQCTAGAFLGDNVYPSGIADAEDREFFVRFVKSYSKNQSGFLERSYFSLGNHDWGPLSPSRKRAQNLLRLIADSKALGARGATHFYHAQEGEFQLVNLDSNYFVRNCSAEFRSSAAEEKAIAQVISAVDSPFAKAEIQCPSATDASELPLSKTAVRKIYQAACSTYQDKDSCRAATITLGHHPWFSNGAHGSAGRYRDTKHFSIGPGQAYKSILESEVRPHSFLYFSGHDHGVQVHLDAQEPTTLSVVVGSGAKVTQAGSQTRAGSSYHQPAMALEAFCRLGFATVEAMPSQTTLRIYSLKGSKYEDCLEDSEDEQRSMSHDMGKLLGPSNNAALAAHTVEHDLRCKEFQFKEAASASPEQKRGRTWQPQGKCSNTQP